MGKYAFTDEGWENFLYWITEDRKKIKKINELIKDIMRNGVDNGIGHPEPLKGDKSGWWSRHIDGGNRIVYRMRDGELEIASCKEHYEDK
ncbi:MAG: Txe/YoeB family addiction module toxin [Ruminococcus sp.]|jgi:toxin YoeB|nr:Txe/YoeB family addiction module toxin [Ruminococcus sp.]